MFILFDLMIFLLTHILQFEKNNLINSDLQISFKVFFFTKMSVADINYWQFILTDKLFVVLGGTVLLQTSVIYMVTNRALLLEDRLPYSHEAKFVQKPLSNKQNNLAAYFILNLGM